MITVITCTGSRPESFELCQKYMAAQTVKPDQWIVVHDGITKKELAAQQAAHPEFQLYIGPRPYRAGLNTMRFNFEEALKHVSPDSEFILIFEDDDYYAPTYIEEIVKMLNSVQIAGLSNNRYYSLKVPGWREMGNYKHSSLCSTGIRKSVLPLLQAAVDSGELYFDIHLWGNALAQKLPFFLQANSSLCVGIKGMPGRPGAGIGHRNIGYSMDSSLVKMTEWLGAKAVETYKPFISKVSNVVAPKPVAKPIAKPMAKALPKTAPVVSKQPLPKSTVMQAPSATPNPMQSGPVVTQAQAQKAAMARLPQAPVLDPLAAEIRPETSNQYPLGERTQGDQFK